MKLVSDESFERARRSGRFDGTLDEFQSAGGARFRALRATRDAALRRARHVFCPSAYLRDVALRWGLDPERVSVLPNPAPPIPELPERNELRRELDLEGDVVVFAGRLGPQKAVGVLLEALTGVAGVSLVVAGDGPEREELERRASELGLDGRVRFLGSVPRDAVLRLFHAADASVLPSAWENFPHTVVEALAVGCPVIATAVGGVPEVVRDGENGLLVCQLGVGIWRFDANMLPTHLVHSPDPHHHHLANIAFGGPDLKTLYITESLSGDILVAPMPVAGKKLYAHL